MGAGGRGCPECARSHLSATNPLSRFTAVRQWRYVSVLGLVVFALQVTNIRQALWSWVPASGCSPELRRGVGVIARLS